MVGLFKSGWGWLALSAVFVVKCSVLFLFLACLKHYGTIGAYNNPCWNIISTMMQKLWRLLPRWDLSPYANISALGCDTRCSKQKD